MNAIPRSEFSHRTRAYNLSRLRAELFDLLIIGGGITGAGIAREAALRGYKVALVEKDDFASGTSSQSSKLVHGGVRYLEHFEFPLVYEASQERRRLLQLAPNHVWPLPFLYPIYRENRYGPALINVGLWMYDGLALFRNTERHHMLSTGEISRQLPALDVSRIVGGAAYYDAQTNDARLTLETVRSAHRNGAVVLNHMPVQALTYNAGRRVDGVQARELVTGEVVNVRARVVVNATGPWTDLVLGLDSPQHKPRLRPTKGIHILVPRARFPIPTAVAFTVKTDQRLMFAIPRGAYTMIGTTDTDYEGSPDEVWADAADVDYVLKAVATEFPRNPLERDDILSTWAGLRPLVAPSGSLAPGAVSREHEIWVTPSGLVNIAGGKLTTYRSMAQQLVARVARILSRDFGVHSARPSVTACTPLIEPNNGSDSLTRQQVEARQSLPPDVRAHLDQSYGTRQGAVLDYVVADSKLRAPIVDGFPFVWAEVRHAVEQEMALSVSDVMVRRLDLFHEVPDGAVIAARDVAGYMSRLLDWLDEDIEVQVAGYAEAVQHNRAALKRRERIAT